MVACTGYPKLERNAPAVRVASTCIRYMADEGHGGHGTKKRLAVEDRDE